jgi:hypothetical protein
VSEDKRDALLRGHLAAMMNFTEQERTYFMGLIEKFLKGSAVESVAFSHSEPQSHRKS